MADVQGAWSAPVAKSAAPGTVAPAPASAGLAAAMIRQFLDRYARRYALIYIAGLGFLVATIGLTVAIPTLQKQVFDTLTALESIRQLLPFDALVPALGPAQALTMATVRPLVWLIAGAAVLVIFVRTLSRILFFNPGRAIEFRLRNDMLQRLLGMSPQFFKFWSIGDIMARAGDDVTFVRALVGFAAIMVLNIVVASSWAMVRMVRTDAWLTLYCVLPLLVSVVALRLGVARTFGMMGETQKALGRLSNTVLETYKGINVVQGAAAESAFLAKFDVDNDAFTALNLRVVAIRTFLMPIVAVVGNICIFFLLLIGGQHVAQGRMTLGDVAAYASYVAILVGALASGGWVIGVLQRGVVSLRRVWDVIELTTDLPIGDVALPTGGRGIHLHIQNLSYRHPDAAQNAPLVLDSLTLDLAPGHVLGVYGAVGAGKSTLVSLLARLHLPPRGTVTLDGVDLLDVARDDLRRAVAIVPQDAFLFSRSVRENIGYIDRVADIDDARVQAAVQKACLQGDLERLPQGLATIVGERGQTLSGGQRQRVQLARAFYRGYRLLVLDDVLSAVDHDTEAKLLAAIQADIAAKGTSAILISHRLSALAAADEIVVLDAGRVAERGTHAQLLAGAGTYARVWAAQSAEGDEAVQPLAAASA